MFLVRPSDSSYFQVRRDEELRAAERAQCAAARDAHRGIAGLFDAMIPQSAEPIEVPFRTREA